MKKLLMIPALLLVSVVARAEQPAIPGGSKAEATRSEAAKLPALDTREAAAISAKLKESLDAPPEKLEKQAQVLLRQVKGELEYGKQIAVLDTHITMLVALREECRLRGEESARDRKAAAKELEEELVKLKDLHRDNPEVAERAQVELIVAFRASLQAMKSDEEHYVKQSSETSKHLLELRMRKARLVEKQKLDVRGITTRSTDLVLPMMPPLLEAPRGPLTAAPSKETLEAAMRSIEKYKE